VLTVWECVIRENPDTPQHPDKWITKETEYENTAPKALITLFNEATFG